MKKVRPNDRASKYENPVKKDVKSHRARLRAKRAKYK